MTDFLPRGRVPYADAAVIEAQHFGAIDSSLRRDQGAIGRERKPAHDAIGAAGLDAPQFFAFGDVPDAHGSVGAAGDQRLAVGEEHHALDIGHQPVAGFVAAQESQALAGSCIAQLDVALFARNGQDFAVGREARKGDLLAIAEAIDASACGDFKHGPAMVRVSASSADRNEPAV